MTPAPQQHCEHECVCNWLACNVNCDTLNEPCIRKDCDNDTRSRPAPSPDETLSKLISENARLGAELKRVTEQLQRANGEHDGEISAKAREDYARDLHSIICILYDDGFKSPIVTYEAAVDYLKSPTVPGHPEKQKPLRTQEHP